MFIKNIALFNFRNYTSLKQSFAHRFNLFIGSNGQGKTNLLEALYLATHFKSFKTSNLQNLFCHHATFPNELAIHLTYQLQQQEHEISFQLRREDANKVKSEILLNKKEIPQKKDYQKKNRLSILLLTNEDILLAKKEPKARRSYFDDILSLLKPEYKMALGQFSILLRNRNAELKKKLQTEDWNEGMAKYGSIIVNARKSFLNAIAEHFQKIYFQITEQPHLKPTIVYHQNKFPETTETVMSEKNYMTILETYLTHDLKVNSTSFGPHKDDYLFMMHDTSKPNSQPTKIAEHFSQGQIRLFVYALKFAIFQYFSHFVKTPPILLLDDIFADLDPKKIDLFFQFIQSASGVFLATANANLIGNHANLFDVYHLRNNQLFPTHSFKQNSVITKMA